MRKYFINIITATLLLCLLIGTAVNAATPSTRIKDIARLQGVRSNQLNGMGLIVGLNGTGDSSKANVQIVANVLKKWGVEVDVASLKVKNVAAVALTANMPPYLHEGDTIDVQVSSIGDAKSLQGGVLLQSPLTGADGMVYVVAQGSVYLGGFVAGDGDNSVQKNVTTVGLVPSGGIVEREIPMVFAGNGIMRWVLNKPDFTTASRLANTINNNIASGAARAVDMGMVEVILPNSYANDPIPFVSEIENLPITPDGIAKVVVNERNGTVVIGDKVKIAPVVVTHRNTIVKISSKSEVSQPNSLSRGSTAVTNSSKVNVKEEEGRLIELQEGTTIGGIVRSLNAVGTTPQDIIAILVAIKESGALYGSLEFI